MTTQKIDYLAEQMLQRLPELNAIWHRLESDSVIDVRIGLAQDTWHSREAAIDAMLELQREMIGDLLINFSFVLPDVAYDDATVGAANLSRVHSFA